MRTVVDAIAETSCGTATLTVAGIGSEPDTCLPWSAVNERAQRMAAVLARLGIGRGSRVGLLGDTSAGLITAIQAVWLRGAAFTILPLPSRTHLLPIIADARFDLLVADEESCAALSHAVKVVALSTLDSEAAAPLPAVNGRSSRRLVRLGRAVSGTQIRIVDETTGLAVAARAVGHIEVSGPSVVGGGWLRTGDLGYLADSELVVCGRAKDVLFAAGRNVYPQDVEAAASPTRTTSSLPMSGSGPTEATGSLRPPTTS